MRTLLVLAGIFLYLAMALGLRMWMHYRRTGSTGFRGISGRPGSIEWVGGVLFVLALALTVAAPLLESSGVDAAWVPPTGVTDALGAAAALAGLLGTWWSQGAMGRSWRIGVDESERTGLVSGGPFRLVRNPIYSFMMLAMIGLVLLLRNASSVVALTLLGAALEIQVRAVEEPYLRRLHGDAYQAYCRRVGRFLPGLGRDSS